MDNNTTTDSLTDEQLEAIARKGLPKLNLGSLTDSDTFDGFTTHDLISGLHAVCVAIDSAIVDGAEFENHHNTMCGLAQAAKVLSSILNTQVHS